MFLLCRSVVICCLMLTAWTVADAEPPLATITGPTGGVAGNILLLDARASTGDFFQWMAFPEMAGGGETIQPIEDGRRAIVCSVPGDYVVVLAVGNKDGLVMKRYSLRVTGASPSPNPLPGPTPQPDPVPGPKFPASVLGLSQPIYDAAMLVPNARQEAPAIAKNLRGVCSQVAAQTLSGRKAIVGALQQLNQSTLSDPARFDAWSPVLKGVISKQLSDLDKAGRLKTDSDITAAFIEIAVGLEAVK